ncbi:hypothetical protein scyTo_0024274, partial [Scyliorhinus torazame]|nr:hypothetical protein [Scyliorhinus torazame]
WLRKMFRKNPFSQSTCRGSWLFKRYFPPFWARSATR